MTLVQWLGVKQLHRLANVLGSRCFWNPSVPDCWPLLRHRQAITNSAEFQRQTEAKLLPRPRTRSQGFCNQHKWVDLICFLTADGDRVWTTVDSCSGWNRNTQQADRFIKVWVGVRQCTWGFIDQLQVNTSETTHWHTNCGLWTRLGRFNTGRGPPFVEWV